MFAAISRTPVVCAFFLGAISVLGFSPFDVYIIPIVSVAITIGLLSSQNFTRRKTFLIGFAFAFGLLVVGTSWIYVSLHNFGGMNAPVAALATLLFCVIFAVPLGLMTAPLNIQALPRKIRLLIFLPLAFCLSDWVRSWLFTGFPWLSLGYSQIPFSPLAGFTPIVGVYGISLILSLMSGWIAYRYITFQTIPPGARPRHLIVSIFTLMVVAAAGITAKKIQWTQELQTTGTSVALLQGNIAQDVKWDQTFVLQTLEQYLQMASEENAEIILLPETALPILDINLPNSFKEAFSDLTNNRGSNIVYGIPEKSNDGKFFNSVMSVGVSGEQTYRKHHLVPFGDYFPTWQPITWIMQSLSIPMSNFSRGEKYQSPIRAGSQKIAANICYEDVFGEEIIRQLPDATVLANFTNDAWWGDSLGPKQHLQIAQTRALETGREMLRVTNTGMTAIIGHDGYILSSIPQFEKQTLRGVIQGRTGQTPYVKYGNLLFLAMCVIVALAGLAWHRLFHARTR